MTSLTAEENLLAPPPFFFFQKPPDFLIHALNLEQKVLLPGSFCELPSGKS